MAKDPPKKAASPKKSPASALEQRVKKLAHRRLLGWTKSAGYQGAVVIEKAFSFLD